ncbi:MAG: endonuclease III [Dehalococcoidia bacterium]|nr:MAG: endonuclease III [Dehalococcoidia bacterium]
MSSFASPHRIRTALATHYGEPSRFRLPLGNKRDPLDELIYILLTVQTQYGVDGVWDALKSRFPTWDHVLRAREESLRRVIAPLGLSEQRAKRIRIVLRAIRDEMGTLSLRRLRRMSTADAEAFLTSLPGVGLKVARCVLMYTCGHDVLPVDAHVLRVSKRVGLLTEETSWPDAHESIHRAVRPEHRYSLHVNLVRLGRDLCGARVTQCHACPLARMCMSARLTSPT